MDLMFAEALRSAVGQVMSQEHDWRERLAEMPQTVGEEVAAQVCALLGPSAFREAVTAELKAEGTAVLEGAFPIGDDLPDTPRGFLPVPDVPTTLAMILAVLGANTLLGKATVSYGSENDGALFVNLVTIAGDGRAAEKSQKAMRGHTDAMSFPFPGEVDPSYPGIAPSPDLVCLAALRNPDGVPTTVMPLHLILKLLPPADIAELKKRQYVLSTQRTFEQGTKDVLGEIHTVSAASVLLAVNDSYWVRFSHERVAPPPYAEAADLAVSNFKGAAAESARGIPLAPGDLLLVDNRRALHGRGRVGDVVGGQSRWLVRTYALASEYAALHFYDGSTYKLWP